MASASLNNLFSQAAYDSLYDFLIILKNEWIEEEKAKITILQNKLSEKERHIKDLTALLIESKQQIEELNRFHSHTEGRNTRVSSHHERQRLLRHKEQEKHRDVQDSDIKYQSITPIEITSHERQSHSPSRDTPKPLELVSIIVCLVI